MKKSRPGCEKLSSNISSLSSPLCIVFAFLRLRLQNTHQFTMWLVERRELAPWERAALSLLLCDHDCVTKQTHVDNHPVWTLCAKFVRLECFCFWRHAKLATSSKLTSEDNGQNNECKLLPSKRHKRHKFDSSICFFPYITFTIESFSTLQTGTDTGCCRLPRSTRLQSPTHVILHCRGQIRPRVDPVTKWSLFYLIK